MSVRKTTAKTAETTKAAVKTTPVKTEEPKTETAAAKKAPAKKATPVKKETTTVKKTAAVKKTAEKTEVKESVFLQFAGAEYNLDDVKANVKKAWMAETGKKESVYLIFILFLKLSANHAFLKMALT